MFSSFYPLNPYTCLGDDWPPGKIPRCKYCREVATWELMSFSSTVLLCDGARCHAAYIAAEGSPIDYIDGPAEWRRCKDCGKVWVFVDETCDQCPECRSENTEMVDEAELAAESGEFTIGGRPETSR